MITELNIGDILLKFFDGVISFFNGLYGFFAYEITIPTFVKNVIHQFDSNFSASGISVWLLLSAGGAGIALAIGVYYIIKGPI